MWYIFKFFTTWSLILTLAHAYTGRFLNIVYMSYLVAFMGLYFSFVNPKKFVVYSDDGERIVFNGLQKFIFIDVLFHISICIFAFHVFGRKRGNMNGYMCVALFMLLYATLVDVRKVYGVAFNEMAVVFVIANIFFFLCIVK